MDEKYFFVKSRHLFLAMRNGVSSWLIECGSCFVMESMV